MNKLFLTQAQLTIQKFLKRSKRNFSLKHSTKFAWQKITDVSKYRFIYQTMLDSEAVALRSYAIHQKPGIYV